MNSLMTTVSAPLAHCEPAKVKASHRRAVQNRFAKMVRCVGFGAGRTDRIQALRRIFIQWCYGRRKYTTALKRKALFHDHQLKASKKSGRKPTNLENPHSGVVARQTA